MTEKTTLWAVNIHGPDDLIPVKSYLDAIKVANSFNGWWQGYIAAKGLHEYDPRMWALPVEYPYGAESHAKSVDGPYGDYEEFVRAALEGDAS